MKPLTLMTAAFVALAGQSWAGEPQKGKTCDYDGYGFGTGAPTRQFLACRENDGMMARSFTGGRKVTILDSTSPPYVRPDCSAGRDRQILVRSEALGSFWTYPIYLRCP